MADGAEGDVGVVAGSEPSGLIEMQLVGTQLVVSNAAYFLASRLAFAPSPTEAAAELEVVAPLGLRAVVIDGQVTITARPAGTTTIGDVATVRAASGNPAASSTQLVVDFGGMRTVSALGAPEGTSITGLEVWLGTAFSGEDLTGDGSAEFQQFQEVQTERLLVTLDDTTAPGDLADDGIVTTSTPPADLELLVGGRRSWSRPGAVPAGFEETIAIKADLQAAVDGGTADVPIVLRSRVPGQLSATPQVAFLRTYPVAFPDGADHIVDVDEEGVVVVPLPLPPEASGWSVARVEASVRADPVERRVLPPTAPAIPGPVAGGGADTRDRLLLDPDHPVLVALPAAHLQRLAVLEGLRIHLLAATGGATIGGVVLADAGGIPGEPVKDGTLGPTPVPADEDGAWVSVLGRTALALKPNTPLWAEIHVQQGRVSSLLAIADPQVPAQARLLRRTPNGRVKPLSLPAGLPATTGAVRLVGIPARTAPIPLVEAALPGTADPAVFTPTADGVGLRLGADPPITTANGGIVDGALPLRLVVGAPCRLTLSSVVVAYTEATA